MSTPEVSESAADKLMSKISHVSTDHALTCDLITMGLNPTEAAQVTATLNARKTDVFGADVRHGWLTLRYNGRGLKGAKFDNFLLKMKKIIAQQVEHKIEQRNKKSKTTQTEKVMT